MDGDRPLKEIFEEYLASGDVKLPPFDKTARRVQAEISKPEPDIKEMESIIEVDQALTAQVLRMANSAFFRGLSKVETVREAIVRLGIDQISALVLLVTQKKLFTANDPMVRRFMERLWRHSVGTALASDWLARKSGYPQLASHAFVAGLLHDIGKLFLLTVIETIRSREQSDFNPSRDFIHEIMDSLHTEQGFRLAQNWNLPEDYCIITRDHHVDSFDSRNPLLVLVRMGDKTCNTMGISVHEAAEPVILVTTPEAITLELSEVNLAELEIMLEDAPLLKM